ncbi:hypothetical protein HJC23_013654 [Cyclotella cryptica]|uniref:Uncharacterized protein n=1 Tax=Cyclotella cryptica TaxID=29204 RepID=A0ABD3R163_9STRA
MLISLNREGLLRLSLTRHRWEWDEEKIQSRKLSDDVALFFADNINKLPADVKTALSALSCFGASTDSEVIQALQTHLELKLVEPLNVAVAEGLVYKLDGIYHFCHDKIQQAAYSMIEDVRCLHHMMYGLSLIDLSLETEDAGLLFTAVTQINLGGPFAVQEEQQYSLIAKYNLVAGKKAMAMSDFAIAFAFFEHGMSFLPNNYWQNEYDLSLDLFNLAAKCALTIKNLTSLTMICDQILRNARNPDDMLNASFISMSALTYSKVSEAVHYGLTVLRQLNIDIPDSISQENTMRLIFQTKSKLNEISDEMILNYQIMSDFKKVMAMKFLAELGNALQQVNPDLQPFVTITMVRLTIEHGLSPMSSVGFAYFGGMVGALGDIRGGYRYTKLAKSLLDKTQSNEVAGSVICITTEVLSYVQPQQTAIEYRLQGERIALAAGDIHWACMNKLMYTSSLPWCGAKLSVAKKAFADAGRFMEEHGHLAALSYLKTVEHTVLAFIGDKGQMISDDQLTQSEINKNPYLLVVVYFQKLFLALILNKYYDLKRSAEKFFEVRLPTCNFLTGRVAHAFNGGLASFRIYRETGDPLWAERGRACKQSVLLWREQASLWNFEHKCFLLEAEECYSEGNFENAKVLYDHAISSAGKYKYVNVEALACELAARFYLYLNNSSTAVKYFTLAHDKYFEWGALAKVRTLHEFIQETFKIDLTSPSANGIGISDDDLPSFELKSETRKRSSLGA